jgi:hypothetical protein
VPIFEEHRRLETVNLVTFFTFEAPPEAATLKLILHVRSRSLDIDRTTEQQLAQGITTIGRARNAMEGQRHITAAAIDMLSAYHAEIELKGELVWLTDTSTNGIYLNGTRLTKGIPYQVRDEQVFDLLPKEKEIVQVAFSSDIEVMDPSADFDALGFTQEIYADKDCELQRLRAELEEYKAEIKGLLTEQSEAYGQGFRQQAMVDRQQNQKLRWMYRAIASLAVSVALGWGLEYGNRVIDFSPGKVEQTAEQIVAWGEASLGLIEAASLVSAVALFALNRRSEKVEGIASRAKLARELLSRKDEESTMGSDRPILPKPIDKP